MTSSQVQDAGGGGGWHKGKLIDDRFELIEAVSQSEDSCLWEGYDQARSSPVILSRLENYDKHGRIPGSLRRQAKLASDLSSRHVSLVCGLGGVGGRCYIVYEGIANGQPLSRLVGGDKGAVQMTVERAVEVCQEVAEGLASMHDAGLVHGTLSISTVLIDSRGAAKVMNAGTCGHTPGSRVLLPHVSPAVAAGMGKATFGCDLWALGVLLHTLAYNKLPPRGQPGGSPDNTTMGPRTVDGIIHRAMSGEYSGAKEAAKDLLDLHACLQEGGSPNGNHCPKQGQERVSPEFIDFRRDKSTDEVHTQEDPPQRQFSALGSAFHEHALGSIVTSAAVSAAAPVQPEATAHHGGGVQPVAPAQPGAVAAGMSPHWPPSPAFAATHPSAPETTVNHVSTACVQDQQSPAVPRSPPKDESRSNAARVVRSPPRETHEAHNIGNIVTHSPPNNTSSGAFLSNVGSLRPPPTPQATMASAMSATPRRIGSRPALVEQNLGESGNPFLLLGEAASSPGEGSHPRVTSSSASVAAAPSFSPSLPPSANLHGANGGDGGVPLPRPGTRSTHVVSSPAVSKPRASDYKPMPSPGRGNVPDVSSLPDLMGMGVGTPRARPPITTTAPASTPGSSTTATATATATTAASVLSADTSERGASQALVAAMMSPPHVAKGSVIRSEHPRGIITCELPPACEGVHLGAQDENEEESGDRGGSRWGGESVDETRAKKLEASETKMTAGPQRRSLGSQQSFVEGRNVAREHGGTTEAVIDDVSRHQETKSSTGLLNMGGGAEQSPRKIDHNTVWYSATNAQHHRVTSPDQNTPRREVTSDPVTPRRDVTSDQNTPRREVTSDPVTPRRDVTSDQTTSRREVTSDPVTPRRDVTSERSPPREQELSPRVVVPASGDGGANRVVGSDVALVLQDGLNGEVVDGFTTCTGTDRQQGAVSAEGYGVDVKVRVEKKGNGQCSGEVDQVLDDDNDTPRGMKKSSMEFDIHKAISSCSDGDTINIPACELFADLLLTRPVTLRAAPLSSSKPFSSRKSTSGLVQVLITGRVVVLSKGVRLEGVTFLGDVSKETGGCIIVQGGGELVMSECTVRCEEGFAVCVESESRASIEMCSLGGGSGHARCRDGGRIDLMRCEMSDNSETAVQIQGGGLGSVDRCMIRSCGRNGVSVVGSQSLCVMMGCSIHKVKENALTAADGGELRVEDCSVSESDGMGLVSEGMGATLIAKQCQVTGSTGAGIACFSGGELEVVSSNMTENGQGIVAGGAGSQASVKGCKIEKSKLQGVWCQSKAKATVVDCQIAQSLQTGVMTTDPGTKLEIVDTSVLNSRGRGVLVLCGATAKLTSCTVRDNHAQGVASLGEGSTVELEKCTVARNAGGGCLASEDGTISAFNCTDGEGHPVYVSTKQTVKPRPPAAKSGAESFTSPRVQQGASPMGTPRQVMTSGTGSLSEVSPRPPYIPSPRDQNEVSPHRAHADSSSQVWAARARASLERGYSYSGTYSVSMASPRDTGVARHRHDSPLASAVARWKGKSFEDDILFSDSFSSNASSNTSCYSAPVAGSGTKPAEKWLEGVTSTGMSWGRAFSVSPPKRPPFGEMTSPWGGRESLTPRITTPREFRVATTPQITTRNHGRVAPTSQGTTPRRDFQYSVQVAQYAMSGTKNHLDPSIPSQQQQHRQQQQQQRQQQHHHHQQQQQQQQTVMMGRSVATQGGSNQEKLDQSAAAYWTQQMQQQHHKHVQTRVPDLPGDISSVSDSESSRNSSIEMPQSSHMSQSGEGQSGQGITPSQVAQTSRSNSRSMPHVPKLLLPPHSTEPAQPSHPIAGDGMSLYSATRDIPMVSAMVSATAGPPQQQRSVMGYSARDVPPQQQHRSVVGFSYDDSPHRQQQRSVVGFSHEDAPSRPHLEPAPPTSALALHAEGASKSLAAPNDSTVPTSAQGASNSHAGGQPTSVMVPTPAPTADLVWKLPTNVSAASLASGGREDARSPTHRPPIEGNVTHPAGGLQQQQQQHSMRESAEDTFSKTHRAADSSLTPRGTFAVYQEGGYAVRYSPDKDSPAIVNGLHDESGMSAAQRELRVSQEEAKLMGFYEDAPQGNRFGSSRTVDMADDLHAHAHTHAHLDPASNVSPSPGLAAPAQTIPDLPERKATIRGGVNNKLQAIVEATPAVIAGLQDESGPSPVAKQVKTRSPQDEAKLWARFEGETRTASNESTSSSTMDISNFHAHTPTGHTIPQSDRPRPSPRSPAAPMTNLQSTPLIKQATSTIPQSDRPRSSPRSPAAPITNPQSPPLIKQATSSTHIRAPPLEAPQQTDIASQSSPALPLRSKTLPESFEIPPSPPPRVENSSEPSPGVDAPPVGKSRGSPPAGSTADSRNSASLDIGNVNFTQLPNAVKGNGESGSGKAGKRPASDKPKLNLDKLLRSQSLQMKEKRRNLELTKMSGGSFKGHDQLTQVSVVQGLVKEQGVNPVSKERPAASRGASAQQVEAAKEGMRKGQSSVKDMAKLFQETRFDAL